MSEVKQPQLIQANKSKKEDHKILDSLAKDHYLVLQEKEQWVKGRKVSNPTLRVIAKDDMESFLSDKFFEKHEITVEILHDPNLGSGSDSGKTLDMNKITKKKEDYVKELAALLEIDASDIDQKLTIKQLEQMIAEAAGGGDQSGAGTGTVE